MHLTTYLATFYVPHRNVGAGAAGQMASTLRLFERFLDYPPKLEDLNERTVAEFLADYGGTRAACTVNDRRRDLLAIWQALADEEKLPAPNRRRIPRRKQPTHLPTAWTLHDLAAIIKHLSRLDYQIEGVAAKHYWPSLVLTIFATGCRISALRSTLSADVNLDADPPWILVRAEHQKTDDDQLFSLTPEATKSIALHYDPGRVLVWPWTKTGNYFSKLFRRHLTEAGYPPTGRAMDLFHRLRRTHATYVAKESGVDAAAASLRHSDPRLTIRSYIDPRIANHRDQVAAALPSVGG